MSRRVTQCYVAPLAVVMATAAAVWGGRFMLGCGGPAPDAEPKLTDHPASGAEDHAIRPIGAATSRAERATVAAPRPSTGPGKLPSRGYHPRDPEEWQGMLVDLSVRASCALPSHCGLAAACVDGACGPCSADDDCAAGEACVLDHCLRKENLQCRSRRDCDGSPCVLSGYSTDPRGNGGMKAYCLDPLGEQPRPAEPPAYEQNDSDSPPEPSIREQLLDSLREEER